MTRRAVSTMLVLVASLLSLINAGSAQAAGTGGQASCSFSFPLHATPGLGVTAGSGTFNSGGEVGTMSCTGTIAGYRVTGPGTFGFDGTIEGSCLGHRGSGMSGFTIATEAGMLHISGAPGFTVEGIGVLGKAQAVHATMQIDDQEPVPAGISFTGSYLLVPVKGNCVTEPVTQAQVLLSGTITSAPSTTQTESCDLNLGIAKLNCRSRG